jgi:phosphoglucosamine mutase
MHERDAMQKLPQRLVNVRAPNRQTLTAVMEGPAITEAIDREQAALEGRGRVLVRASGTEPLIRVMVEAPSQDETGAVCGRLVELVEAELGTLSGQT